MGGESERPYCLCSAMADKVKGCHESLLEPEPNLAKPQSQHGRGENQLKKRKKKSCDCEAGTVIRSQNI